MSNLAWKAQNTIRFSLQACNPATRNRHLSVMKTKQTFRNFAANKNRRMKTAGFLTAFLLCLAALNTGAQEETDLTPQVHGTLRGKYEYQTEESKGRFEVRTARVDISGNLSRIVSYKAEIDLCDEGSIKMLDAYTRLRPWDNFQLTIGQERVPFTIDAHRSPSQQYFANRSFIAKQVGNVRDVGAEVGYTFHPGFPINLRAGIFNGSGLTNQKDFWTNEINFSTKAVFYLPVGLNVELSAQKIKPDHVSILMYDGGVTWHHRNFLAEVEYLYKHYAEGAFQPVHAFDSFVCYDIPLRHSLFQKVSPLLRYDFMTDHSDGYRYKDGIQDTSGSLIINDYKRSRITGGITFSLDKPFVSDIRINYEKYFYGHNGIAKTSEKDKIVVEFMTRF